MLFGVHIQHEVDQRPFKPCTQAPIDGETRAGNFRGTLQVKNAQLRSQIPMSFGREIKFARFATPLYLYVVMLVLAHWDASVGNIRNARQKIERLGVQLAYLRIQLRNLFTRGAHLLLALCGVFTLLAQLADLRRGLVALRLQLLCFCDALTATPI